MSDLVTSSSVNVQLSFLLVDKFLIHVPSSVKEKYRPDQCPQMLLKVLINCIILF